MATFVGPQQFCRPFKKPTAATRLQTHTEILRLVYKLVLIMSVGECSGTKYIYVWQAGRQKVYI